MPLIECTLIKGYEKHTRQLLNERLTDAACSVIGAKSDFVIVTIKEVDSDNYMRGRSIKTPAAAPKQADDIIRAFLTAMEARDLETAKTFLADPFKMTFPGNTSLTTLEDLVAWGQTRYKFVKKDIEDISLSFHELNTIGYCHGTLSGEWLDGTLFENIRFIDRFEITQDGITKQDVWNDMALYMPPA